MAESIVVCHSHHLFACEIELCSVLLSLDHLSIRTIETDFLATSYFREKCDASIEFVSRHSQNDTQTGDNRRSSKIHNFFRYDFFVLHIKHFSNSSFILGYFVRLQNDNCSDPLIVLHLCSFRRKQYIEKVEQSGFQADPDSSILE